MRVLVSGATGFLGSHIARRLHAAGHQVRLLARDPAKVERVFGGGHGLDVVVGDMCDRGATAAALKGMDGLVHSAALVSLDPRRGTETIHHNTLGTELLVGGAVEAGLSRVIHVSSLAAILRPGGPVPRTDRPVQEAGGGYGRSKARCEAFVRRLQSRGAPIQITYPCALIGAEDPGLSEGNRALATMLRSAVLITSSGLQLVDVQDAADGHQRLLEGPAASGQHVVGGHYVTWPQLADMLDEITGRRMVRVHAPGALLRGMGSVLDKLQQVHRFDVPVSHEAMTFATRWVPTPSSSALGALGARYRPARESIASALTWLHRERHLKRVHVGQLAVTR